MHMRYTLTGSGVEFKVWLEYPELWQYFSKTALPAPDGRLGVDKVVTVKGSTVRQGPGDTSRTSRSGGSRRVWSAPSFKGSSVPGKTVFLCEPNAMASIAAGEPTYREKRQVAMSGPFLGLYNYFKANAKFEMVVISPAGRSYTIEAAGGGTLLTGGGGIQVPGSTP